MIGAANAIGTRAAGGTIPNVFASTPFYRNFTDRVNLKSYGLFCSAKPISRSTTG